MPDASTRKAVAALGALGGPLFYGDGMIIPAICVLSAIEEMVAATPSVADRVSPCRACLGPSASPHG